MIITDFKPFKGQHCETTATGTLLKNIGIEFSEPMLFGIGEGLGFIFWNMKTMDFPFIGGRVKTDLLTENICRNLNLKLEVKETTSTKKAWLNVEESLRAGKAVGLKLDCYHLEYFNNKIHFAGHYAALYGFNDAFAFLVDTDQQGCLVKTSLKSLESARNEKGPMSSRNLSFTIDREKELPDLASTIKKAIKNNAEVYLNPPITNLCYKGIEKTAREIKKWLKTSKNVKEEFQTSATLMEKAGTGGALFRNLYRDFLKESADILENDQVSKAHESFVAIAKDWTNVSNLFYLIGESQNEQYLSEASTLLFSIAQQEKETMELLSKV